MSPCIARSGCFSVAISRSLVPPRSRRCAVTSCWASASCATTPTWTAPVAAANFGAFETAPAPDTMERIPKPGDVKFEDGLKFVYREKPETFVDCVWHCGEICGMPCGIVKDTVDMIIAENQGLLLSQTLKRKRPRRFSRSILR